MSNDFPYDAASNMFFHPNANTWITPQQYEVVKARAWAEYNANLAMTQQQQQQQQLLLQQQQQQQQQYAFQAHPFGVGPSLHPVAPQARQPFYFVVPPAAAPAAPAPVSWGAVPSVRVLNYPYDSVHKMYWDGNSWLSAAEYAVLEQQAQQSQRWPTRPPPSAPPLAPPTNFSTAPALAPPPLSTSPVPPPPALLPTSLPPRPPPPAKKSRFDVVPLPPPSSSVNTSELRNSNSSSPPLSHSALAAAPQPSSLAAERPQPPANNTPAKNMASDVSQTLARLRESNRKVQDAALAKSDNKPVKEKAEARNIKEGLRDVPGKISDSVGGVPADYALKYSQSLASSRGVVRPPLRDAGEPLDFSTMTVKGTCTVLAKEFLRLTAVPLPELVRPEAILSQHLANLKSMYTSPSGVEYAWLCSQLKAIRQDMVVQRLENAFAVDVYETHARIALEQGDLTEFNACQMQIRDLHCMLERAREAETDPAKKEAIKPCLHKTEFVAYRLLYLLYLQHGKTGVNGLSEVAYTLRDLTKAEMSNPAIKHALAVWRAVEEGAYRLFFSLHEDAPAMGAFIMDPLVEIVRFSALQKICKAYRPSVSLGFVLQVLGFRVDDVEDLEERTALVQEGKTYLELRGCLIETAVDGGEDRTPPPTTDGEVAGDGRRNVFLNTKDSVVVHPAEAE